MQKTRSLLWLVAMLIMTALVGCLYEPFDGQVVGQNEKIHFNGSDGLQCYVDHLANANDYLRDCNAGGTVTLEIR